jgi:hypothetical protein
MLSSIMMFVDESKNFNKEIMVSRLDFASK